MKGIEIELKKITSSYKGSEKTFSVLGVYDVATISPVHDYSHFTPNGRIDFNPGYTRRSKIRGLTIPGLNYNDYNLDIIFKKYNVHSVICMRLDIDKLDALLDKTAALEIMKLQSKLPESKMAVFGALNSASYVIIHHSNRLDSTMELMGEMWHMPNGAMEMPVVHCIDVAGDKLSEDDKAELTHRIRFYKGHKGVNVSKRMKNHFQLATESGESKKFKEFITSGTADYIIDTEKNIKSYAKLFGHTSDYASFIRDNGLSIRSAILIQKQLKSDIYGGQNCHELRPS